MKDLFGKPLHTQTDIRGEEYAGVLVRETGAAILFDDGDQQVWLPKTQVRVEDMPGNAGSRALDRAVLVTIPDWLAKEKGLTE